MATGLLGRVLSMALTLLATPILIRQLGTEGFGLCMAITSTLAMLSISNLGLSSGLQNALLGENSPARRQQLISTTAFIVVGCCLVLLLLGGVFGSRIDWTRVFPPSTDRFSAEIPAAVGYAFLGILVAIILTPMSAICAVRQEVHKVNLAIAASAGLGAVSSAAAASAGWGLKGAAAGAALGQAGFLLGWSLHYLSASELAEFRPRWKHVRREAAHELLRRSGFFLLVQVAMLGIVQADALIILHFLRAEEVTPYNVAQKVAGVLLSLYALLTPPLWAAYGNARAADDYSWVERSHRRMQRLVLASYGVVLLGLWLAGPFLLRWWVGVDAAPTPWLLVGVAMVAGLRIWTDVHGVLLNSFEEFRPLMINLIVHPVVTLAVGLTLVTRIGVQGLVVGGLLGYVAFIAWFAPIATARLIARLRAAQQPAAIPSTTTT